ncbi:MAG: hypothetical protein LUM44_12790 [Pyrinomonadaceae bacterium]|nr:hypothetical protein [Pyrinomonadaceae bacterium]
MALDDISKTSETVEKFIRDLAEAFRKKSWVKLLSLVGVVFALLLSPPLVESGLGFFDLRKPLWYSSIVWLSVTASFFAAAFLVAVFTKEKKTIPPAPATSIIKGLLAYTDSKEDSEWFARLQRGNILQDCLRFCEDKELAFGILSGESGTGKTSFLQAGLLLNLKNHGINPVYVKFTDSAPLDSVRQSLNGFADDVPNAENETSLLELLRAAVKKDERPLVLIFDQFEQFFAHRKTKARRKDFIAQMSEWYRKRKTLPVTILISVRNDFVDHLRDFQSEMDYTLTLPNYLSIKKFEPDEAAKVISVIAEEAKIEIDEAFVKELTRFELADREDGTISPIDIQILSWMLDGQRTSDERAFNRKAFQKLGGVEGLLERFLNRALSIRETESRRQSAAKVLLALTDGIVRAGALPLTDIKEKLKGVLPETDIEEAVDWLSRSDVRLVTQFQDKNDTLYEIAHEKLIPPLRRLASKELSDVEKAQQLIDRRYNEWIGNDRVSRYLLTSREWFQIKRNQKIISLNAQKTAFIGLSKRRLLKWQLSLSALAIVILSVYGFARWQENKAETQISYVTQRLDDILVRNKDVNVTLNSLYLLPFLENEKDGELAQTIYDRSSFYSFPLEKMSPAEFGRRLVYVTEISSKLSKPQTGQKLLDGNRYSAPADSDKVRWSVDLAQSHLNLSDTEKALLTLNDALKDNETAGSGDEYMDLLSAADLYLRLSKPERAESILKANENNQNLGVYDDRRTSVSQARIYAKINKPEKALELLGQYERLKTDDTDIFTYIELAEIYKDLQKPENAAEVLKKLIRDDVFSKMPGSISQSMFILQAAVTANTKLFGGENSAKILESLIAESESLSAEQKNKLFLMTARVYLELSQKEKALAVLEKSSVNTLQKGESVGLVLFAAELYIDLAESSKADKLLDKLKNSQADKVYLAYLYARLNEWQKARQSAERVTDERAVLALSLIYIVYKDSQNGTKNYELIRYYDYGSLFNKLYYEPDVNDPA